MENTVDETKVGKKSLIQECLDYWKEWGSPKDFVKDDFYKWMFDTHPNFIKTTKGGTLDAIISKVRTAAKTGEFPKTRKLYGKRNLKSDNIVSKKYTPSIEEVLTLTELIKEKPLLLDHLKAMKDILVIFGSFEKFSICLEYTKSIMDLLDKSKIDTNLFQSLNNKV